jgi:hypothetical protein
VSWSRVSALVCDRCDQDLVYVELRRGTLVNWVSPWFGCGCPDRERLVFADTFVIVEMGGGIDIRVERWGPAR